MREILLALLKANSQREVRAVLERNQLWNAEANWRWLGDTPNNQSIVLAQQSSPAAAMVEKVTNSIDAILIRKCREAGIDPRSDSAPRSMDAAVEQFISLENVVDFAERNLTIFATGTKNLPCIHVFDNGEGQAAKDFPSTLCALIHAHGKANSYKGGVSFVQGRFGMGSTGILPFCNSPHHLQLIISRRPKSLADSSYEEWGFTVLRFDETPTSPGWRYLTADGVNVPTAGFEPLPLLPERKAEERTAPSAFVQGVDSGTLISMYEYTGAKANICGDPFTTHLEQFLLAPKLPIRVVECRQERYAKVTRVTIWDRLGTWEKGDKVFEPEFSPPPTISVELDNGETIPGELRVFRKGATKGSVAGLRALINGQVHAKRDSRLFSGKAVDKTHIADSLLVTLDCSDISPKSRGNLFMANREQFRDGDLLKELLKKLKSLLRTNPELDAINKKRYQEEIESATEDRDGIKVLEELLSTDPTLAGLFSGEKVGKVAAPVPGPGPVETVGAAKDFVGHKYPRFINSRDGNTTVQLDVPRGSTRLAVFYTDVTNDYLTRHVHRAKITVIGDQLGLYQGPNLNRGRLTFALKASGSVGVGTPYSLELRVTDNHGSGPFDLLVTGNVIEPVEPTGKGKGDRKQREPKSYLTPSSLDVKDRSNLPPSSPPIHIQKKPDEDGYVMFFNTKCELLESVVSTRPKEESLKVEFVFKWGLALVCMGMIEKYKEEDILDQAKLEEISQASAAVGRVIVPLCLALPSKLPTLKGAKK